MNRPAYAVLQAMTKTFSYGNYVRVKLENVPVLSGVTHHGLPISVKIDNNPSIPLSKRQLNDIASVLKFDDTTKLVVQMLEKNIIHGDEMTRNTLIKLFEN